MGKLTGQTIAASYDQLLIVDDANGISASLQAVESADTDGSASALKISTNQVEVIPGSDSTTAFEVSQNGGIPVLSVDSTNQRVNIGSSTYYGTDGIAFEVNSVAPGTGVYGGVSIHTWEAGGASTGPQLTLARSKSDSAGNYAIVADNDRIGQIFFKGADSNSFALGATIVAYVDGSPSNGDMPARLVFATSADGSEAPANRMTIDSAGKVGIGTDSPDTYEFLHIQKSNSENIGIKVENTGANGAHFTLRGSADSGAKYNYISSRTEGGTEHWAIAGDGTASTMVMKTGGSERMRIDSSGNVTVSTGNLVIGTAGQGVTFSDTNTPAQSAGTGSSNTLDDYEEGTFTMGFTGATFADVLHTTGHYTKIGNMVHFHYYNNGMTISSASGAARLTGLPFTSMSTAQSYSQFTTVHGNSIDGSSPGGYIDVNQTAGTFVDLNNTLSASWINGADAYIMIQGVYSV